MSKVVFILSCNIYWMQTTNIIFGITDQSQCRKCKRRLSIIIDITNFDIISGNNNIDEFLYFTKLNVYNYQIADYMNHINKKSDPLKVYDFIKNEFKNYPSKPIIEWIRHSQIKNLTKITQGGFGIVYKATRLNSNSNQNEIVAVKRFLNSQNISKPFLNEVIV